MGQGSCWGSGCLESRVLDTVVKEDLPSDCSGGEWGETSRLSEELVSFVVWLQGAGHVWAVTSLVAVETLQLPT